MENWTGKPGQIYLIVDFADGRTTWSFIINRSVPVSPRPAMPKNNKQQNTLAVLVTSCAYNSDGEDGDGSAG